MDETASAPGPLYADRPHMPEGYGIQPVSGDTGLLPWEFARTRLEAARNYWLITASKDGSPHAAPIWGLWVSDSFYFSTDLSSRKGRNLAAGGKAIVHLESGDEAVIVEGRMQSVSSRGLLEQLDASYLQKYSFNLVEPVFRLAPVRVLAWLEKEFITSATRWWFEAWRK